MLASACRRAGLPEHPTHALRHTFAGHLVQSGAQLVVVQKLLGHASIQTTMRYAHLGSGDMRAGVEKLESLHHACTGEAPVEDLEA